MVWQQTGQRTLASSPVMSPPIPSSRLPFGHWALMDWKFGLPVVAVTRSRPATGSAQIALGPDRVPARAGEHLQTSGTETLPKTDRPNAYGFPLSDRPRVAA